MDDASYSLRVVELLNAMPQKIQLQDPNTKKTTSYEFHLAKLPNGFAAYYSVSKKCPDNVYDIYYADMCVRYVIAKDLLAALESVYEYVQKEFSDAAKNDPSLELPEIHEKDLGK